MLQKNTAILDILLKNNIILHKSIYIALLQNIAILESFGKADCWKLVHVPLQSSTMKTNGSPTA